MSAREWALCVLGAALFVLGVLTQRQCSQPRVVERVQRVEVQLPGDTVRMTATRIVSRTTHDTIRVGVPGPASHAGPTEPCLGADAADMSLVMYDTTIARTARVTYQGGEFEIGYAQPVTTLVGTCVMPSSLDVILGDTRISLPDTLTCPAGETYGDSWVWYAVCILAGAVAAFVTTTVF